MKTLRKFFRLLSPPEVKPHADFIEINGMHRMPVVYRRHARAKNYVLRLQADRTVVVTLPRRGSLQFAQEFVLSRKVWLEKQWGILEARRVPPRTLVLGTEVLFRGTPTVLRVEQVGVTWHLCLNKERFPMPEQQEDLRPTLEAHLKRLAKTELTQRVEELCVANGSTIRKVVVRNQRSRWGSCSYNGTISLNWRLLQVPPYVRDYIIIHELMHLRQLNHSPQFWAEVEGACPDYRQAEDWLKENSGQVGF